MISKIKSIQNVTKEKQQQQKQKKNENNRNVQIMTDIKELCTDLDLLRCAMAKK